MEPKDVLLNELDILIIEKKKYEGSDFIWSQYFNWLVIALSITTTIVAAASAPAIATTILSALSAGTILIDKNFSFSKRATWNGQYKIVLETLRDGLRFKNAKVDETSDKLAALKEEMLKSFPNAIFQTK